MLFRGLGLLRNGSPPFVFGLFKQSLPRAFPISESFKFNPFTKSFQVAGVTGGTGRRRWIRTEVVSVLLRVPFWIEMGRVGYRRAAISGGGRSWDTLDMVVAKA